LETCNILLVKDGPQDPFDAIGQRLALDPNVTLASEAPVSVEQAVVMIWEQPEIAVILIIGQESAIPAIASAIRAARSDVHMLAVSIETGITNLSMRNLSFDQLRRIIHMLARPAAPANEGRVLRFHLRTEPNDAEQAEEAAPAAYHPAPLAVEVDGRIADLIDQSLDWVEAATRVLLDVWSPRKDEAPGFVPGFSRASSACSAKRRSGPKSCSVSWSRRCVPPRTLKRRSLSCSARSMMISRRSNSCCSQARAISTFASTACSARYTTISRGVIRQSGWPVRSSPRAFARRRLRAFAAHLR